jgi:amino acid adenylation domain-containing protein
VSRFYSAEVPASTVHELFERHVATCGPQAVALTYGTQRLTYRELQLHARNIAHRLRQAGVRPGDFVVLHLARTPTMISAMLGVLMAGAAYVPTEVTDPSSRLSYIMDDTGAKVILIDSEQTLPQTIKIRVLTINSPLPDAIDTGHDTNALPIAQHKADGPAYLLYTSGSTGWPKGVVMRHSSLVNLLLCHARTRPGSCSSVTAQACAVTFDFSFHEVFSTLCFGGVLAMADEAIRPIPLALNRFLGENKIERLFIPVTSLLRLANAASVDPVPLALREVITTGERLQITPQLRELFHRTGAKLHNHYGATEFQDATWHTLDGDPYQWPTLPPIGRPIDNMRVYVADDRLVSLPTGSEGELCVAGAGLAAGYVNDNELTSRKFIQNVLGEELVYRTGDLARIRADGLLEHLGRVDDQIKLSGVRIEPAELETVLAEFTGVCESVIVVHELNGSSRLVAYVTLNGDVSVDGIQRRLNQHMAARLPKYALPHAYVIVDAIPVTASGKADRRMLRPPANLGRLLDSPPKSPQSETEQLLVGICKEVLGLETVGTEDDLFDLGATSLMTTQLISRVAQETGIQLAAHEPFRVRTIVQLAGIVDASVAARGHPTAELRTVGRHGLLPTSFAQQRLWLLEQLLPNRLVYVLPLAWRLRGEYDEDTLAAALDDVVQRHEALRTQFTDIDGIPYQEIVSSVHVELVKVDLANLSAEEQKRQVHASLDEVASAFDIAKVPLLRARLMRLSGSERVLLLAIHHIVFDDWSAEIFIRDLSTAYVSRTVGGVRDWPDLPVQYPDFAVWQREHLAGAPLEALTEFWLSQLDGVPWILLDRTDFPRPKFPSYSGATHHFDLGTLMLHRIRRMSRRCGVTLFMSLFAAVGIVLSGRSGQPSFTLGAAIANRTHAATEDLIGFFVNTLALPVDLSGDPSVAEFLSRVRSVALGAYQHQDMPFDSLVEGLRVPRDLSTPTLVQSMVVLRNTNVVRRGGVGLMTSPMVVSRRATPFDLTFSFEETPNGFLGEIDYSTELYLASTIEQMAEYLQVVLADMASDVSRSVSVLLGRYRA